MDGVFSYLVTTGWIFGISLLLLLFLTFSVLVGNPKKTTLHGGGQSRSWFAEQGKEKKRENLAARHPPPTLLDYVRIQPLTK